MPAFCPVKPGFQMDYNKPTNKERCMSELLQQALTAKTSGDIALAKRLISQALIQQPNDEAAWMLMADLVDDIRQRRNCLERALAINPKNTDARIAMTKLTTSPLLPVTRGERDKPLNLPKLEKIPPFTWEGGQEQYLTVDELTPTGEVSDQAEQPPETAPTFDWAKDSD